MRHEIWKSRSGPGLPDMAVLRCPSVPIVHPPHRSLLQTILASTPQMRELLDQAVWLDIDLAIPESTLDDEGQNILVQAMLDAARTIACHRPRARRAWIRMRLHHQHLVLLIADDGGPMRDYHSSPAAQSGLSSLVRLAIALQLRLRFHRLRHLNVISLRMPIRRALNFKPAQTNGVKAVRRRAAIGAQPISMAIEGCNAKLSGNIHHRPEHQSAETVVWPAADVTEVADNISIPI